jgi:type III secretory pathway component EscT
VAAELHDVEEVRRQVELERAELEQSLETLEQAVARTAARLAVPAALAAAAVTVGLVFLVRAARRRRRCPAVAARVGPYAVVRLP